MTSTNFSNLRFDRQTRPIPRRLLLVVIMFGAFNLLWWLLPQNALYWVLLLTIIILVWVASHGWRQAMESLHTLIHELEQG